MLAVAGNSRAEMMAKQSFIAVVQRQCGSDHVSTMYFRSRGETSLARSSISASAERRNQAWRRTLRGSVGMVAKSGAIFSACTN